MTDPRPSPAAATSTTSEPRGGPFTRKTAIIIGTVSGISILGTVLLFIFAGDFTGLNSSGANSFSHSAVGHKGLVELLERVDVPVITSRHESARKAADGALLVLAEPLAGLAEDAASMLAEAPNVLVVLPKRRYRPHDLRPGWVLEAPLADASSIDDVLYELDVAGSVSRFGSSDSLQWDGDFGTPTLQDTQLIQDTDLDPLLATDAGILIGEYDHRGWRVVVVSDPDLIANHGLGDGENAAMMAFLIDELRGTRPVIFDETIHGFARSGSVWRELFDPPLTFIVVSAALLAACMLWSGLVRFGSPRLAGDVPDSGKRDLIENTASLLKHGGFDDAILIRYFELAIRSVAERLHLPQESSEDELVLSLNQIGHARNIDTDLSDLRNRVVATKGDHGPSDAQIRRIAQEIHDWWQGMIDDTGRVGGRQRAAS